VKFCGQLLRLVRVGLMGADPWHPPALSPQLGPLPRSFVRPNSEAVDAAVGALERITNDAWTEPQGAFLGATEAAAPRQTEISRPWGYVALLARPLCDGSLRNPCRPCGACRSPCTDYRTERPSRRRTFWERPSHAPPDRGIEGRPYGAGCPPVFKPAVEQLCAGRHPWPVK
jgi:hypothetical protein